MSKEELQIEVNRLWGFVKDADFERKKRLLNEIYIINKRITDFD